MADEDDRSEEPEEAARGACGRSGDEGGARKIVDEGWKAEVRREKEKIDEKIEEKARTRAERNALPPADFMHFISGIAAQTLMQLGDIENPVAGKKAVDLAYARYSIDILAMLEDKTKGNLTTDEEHYIKAVLHDLRMRFVQAAPAGGSPGGEADLEAGSC